MAIAAIALTTLLFTSLFTIALSLNDGFQQSNFRQCGGWSHGAFKYLSQEQFQQLRQDPLVKQWGLRRFLGMPHDVPFNKSHVEIGYSDANQAHWMFCDPIEGSLPQEGTNQAATDTHVLALLGVKPELGAEFTVTFDVDGQQTTQTFQLCGWWEYDSAIVANHILIPESRVNEILSQLNIDPANTLDGMTGSWNLDVMLKNPLHIEHAEFTVTFDVDGQQTTQTFQLCGWWEYDSAIVANHILIPESRVNEILNQLNIDPANTLDGMTGSWNLDVMLKNPLHIEQDLVQILGSHGYQCESRSQGDNFIDIGMLALIVFTGYLIIYNVFQISVAGDIRFYGLLKTIGTTPRQLKRIIRHQALALCLVGIPLGLGLGWLLGAKLTPVIIARLNGIQNIVSVRPVIFLGAAVFSLLTVLLSCARPGRMAARVSPIEAVRYTEGRTGGSAKQRRASHGVSIPRMAWANLGRSRSKTLVTVLSLALAVVLLSVSTTFTGGFDMDKYLRDSVCDFQLADASHFQTGNGFSADTALSEQAISALQSQPGIQNGGRVYGKSSWIQEFITEDYFRKSQGQWYEPEALDRYLANTPRNEEGLLCEDAQLYGMEAYPLSKLYFRKSQGQWYEPEALDRYLANTPRNEEGLLCEDAQLYGMEAYPLSKLNLLEGDLAPLSQPDSHAIAAVYSDDDYGRPRMDSHWAKLGDTIISKLNLLEGDLAPLSQPDSHAIAAVYSDDDYGRPRMDSHWAKLGDTITLRYVEEYQFVDATTGEVLSESQLDSHGYRMMPTRWRDVTYTVTALVSVRYVEEYQFVDATTGEVLSESQLDSHGYRMMPTRWRDVTYTVTALVSVPNSMSYRYYGEDEFILGAEAFRRDTQTDAVLYYACDAEDAQEPIIEEFLQHYTQEENPLCDYEENPLCDYESKATYVAEFESFRSMFSLLGGVLSAVVGLVGVLNFFNAINPLCDYESKATYVAEFESFRSMFSLLGGVLSAVVGLVGVLNFFNAILTGILARKREFAVLQSIGMTGRQLKSMGGVLSAVVGLVGVLNFFNAILTGILARKREFAVLQSIGMTGRQLKSMLICEGLLYALGSVALATAVFLALSPLLAVGLEVLQSIGMTGRQLKSMLICEGLLYALGSVALATAVFLALSPLLAVGLENLFWFFTYRFNLLPIALLAPVFALLGCLVPLVVYHFTARATIVERLREAET